VSPPAPSPPPAPRLLDQVSAFRYVTAENAPSYRALLEVFVEAKEHYLIELSPADVRERLDHSGLAHGLATPEELDRHLDQLDDWGNLQRFHDTAAVARVEDFYRRRYRYRLTAVGEAAHRAVREVEATVGRSGALQTSMLLEIDAALEALVASARAGDAPPLVRALHRLRTAFESLTEEANLFLGELDRQVSSERIDEERFLAYKHALLAYLGRFVDDLRRLRPGIAERVAEAVALEPATWLALAVAGAELPPALPGTDPSTAWIADQRERWSGVVSWFLATASAPPRVERLHAVAVDAVVRLARSLERLNERRVRAADRAADFRALARWFAACPADDDAHALWAAAFGLHPARHLHLADDDPERTRPEVSWWDAPPVDVPVRLRTRGTTSRAGRPPPVLDFSDGRTWMAARRRRERAQIEAALARFSGHGALHLSDLASVSTEELDQLLALLDEALSVRRSPDGSRRARTADGRLEVVLRKPIEERPWVSIDTPGGRLRCCDYQLEVAPVAAGAADGEEAGA
jgi:uncharacterized protein (TIGR02677 family)